MINLKEIREFNNCSQQKLAGLLNVSRSTVAMWETHQSEPSIDILNRISKIFNISLDYLLGEYIDSEGISIARKRVAALLEERDPPFGDVEATFDTSIVTLKAWCDGHGDFFNDKLDKLADFFGVSIDYLLGREEKSSVSGTTENDFKVALFGGDGEVTDEMWDEVKQFAEYIKAKYKKG